MQMSRLRAESLTAEVLKVLEVLEVLEPSLEVLLEVPDNKIFSQGDGVAKCRAIVASRLKGHLRSPRAQNGVNS